MKTYTVLQFAEMLSLSIRTAYHLVSSGNGPKSIRVGRHIRILERDLNEWIDEQASCETTKSNLRRNL